MKKRMLSLLCTLALCLGLLPVTALAEGTAPQALYVGNYQITDSNNTTYLKADSTSEGSLTSGSESDWTVKYEPGSATLTLKNATIKGDSNNSTSSGAGIYAVSSAGSDVALTIVLEGNSTISGDYGIYILADQSSGGAASLTIEGNYGLSVSGATSYGILVYGNSGNASLTIENATVTASTSRTNAAGVGVQSYSTNSTLSIAVNSGSLTASGNENSSSGIEFVNSYGDGTLGTNLTVSDSAVVKANNGIKCTYASKPTPTGTGIVFDGTEGTVYGSVTLQDDLTISEDETLTIGQDASLTVPSGKTMTNNGTVTTTEGGTLTNNGTINNSGTLPETISGNQPPKITTESLLDGTVDTAYNETLQADNTPTQWSVTSGSLPAGLTLDTSTGVISGTPTAADTYNFTVTATNGAGSDSKAFTLTVTANTEPTTYTIATAEQLRNFANAVNEGNTTANAVLTADITLDSDSSEWTPIGKDADNMYNGTFDGQGHTISGLQCSVTSGDFAGLFGVIGSSGVVKNVGIADGNVAVSTTDKLAYAGGVCGWSAGTIENCWNSGSVSASSSSSDTISAAYAGGVCGWNQGTITNCWNSGSVSASSSSSAAYAGGVCGDSADSIENCYWLDTACSTGVGVGRPATDPDVESKTADEFASGEVAWLLNQGQTGTPWGQGSNGMPVLEGNLPAGVTSYVPVRITIVMTDNTQKSYYSAKGSTFTAYPTGYAFVFKDGDTKTWINKGTQTYDADATIYAENMTLEKIPAKAATCTENGNSAYWYCAAFDKYFSDEDGVNEITAASTVIPATGHELTKVAAKEPTSTEAGNIEYWVCNNCGKYFSDEQGTVEIENVVIPATGGSSGGGSSGSSTPTKTPSQQATDKIEAAKDGDTVEITLPEGKTTLDKEVFEELAGRDVTLEIDLGDGLSWTIHGLDIPETANFGDVDMGVSMNSGSVPVDIINAITGEVGTMQLTLAHDGEFGFTLTLTAPLGAKNAGYWANLYYYDEDAESLTFQTSARIDEDGTAALVFTHASQYVIVIDDRDHTPKDFPFVDVTTGDWFYEAVDDVFQRDLMTGTDATHFTPDGTSSRAMVATILWRMAGEPSAREPLTFADVPADTWYTEAVRWAASEGIVTGYSDTKFGPDDPVTREQFAVMLYRYAQTLGEGFTGSWSFPLNFPDAAQVSDYAYEALCWMTMEKVINGMEDGNLHPQGTATRAQLATMLQRFCQAADL